MVKDAKKTGAIQAKKQDRLWRWGYRLGLLLILLLAIYVGPGGRMANIILWDHQVNRSTDMIRSDEMHEAMTWRWENPELARMSGVHPMVNTVFYDYPAADTRWAEVLDIYELRIIKQPVLIDLSEPAEGELKALIDRQPSVVVISPDLD